MNRDSGQNPCQFAVDDGKFHLVTAALKSINLVNEYLPIFKCKLI